MHACMLEANVRSIKFVFWFLSADLVRLDLYHFFYFSLQFAKLALPSENETYPRRVEHV